MDRLTKVLVGLAVGLGLLAARDARRAKQAGVVPSPAQPPWAPPPKGDDRKRDAGMVVLRNEPIDDAMVVRPPFNGDPGIVGNGRTTSDRRRTTNDH